MLKPIQPGEVPGGPPSGGPSAVGGTQADNHSLDPDHSRRYFNAQRVARVTARGIAAVADQALIAGTAFVAAWLLALWLPPQEYGVFALGYATVSLVHMLHGAAVSEPMLVLCAGRFRETQASYMHHLLSSHFRVGAIWISVWCAVYVVLRIADYLHVAPIAAALAFTLPPMALLSTYRRQMYLYGRNWISAVAGGLVLVTTAVLLLLAQSRALLTVTTAFLALGAGALIGILCIFRLIPIVPDRAGSVERRTVYDEHWKYGKWAAPTALLKWIPDSLPYFLIAILVSSEAVGAFRAAVNLVLPARHVVLAATLVLLPTLSASLSNKRYLTKTVARALGILGAGGALWAACLIVWPDVILSTLYAGRYAEAKEIVIILATVPLLTGVSAVLNSYQKASGYIANVFSAHALAAIVAVVAGLILIVVWGLLGAALATWLSLAVVAGAAVWQTRPLFASGDIGGDPGRRNDRAVRVGVLHGINYFNAGDHGISLAMFSRLKEEIPGCEITVFSPFLDASARMRDHVSRVKAGYDDLYPPEIPDLFQLPAGRALGMRDAWAAVQGLGLFLLLRILPFGVRRTVATWNQFGRNLLAQDLVISKGGGFLLDRGTRYPIPMHLVTIGIATALRKPVVIYAQTIGPFDRALSRAAARSVLKSTNRIVVRDQYSAEYVEGHLGIDRERMLVTADEAFQLRAPEGQPLRDRRKVGITLVAPVFSGMGSSRSVQYEESIATVVDEILTRGIDEAVFVPHLESGVHNDRDAANRICQRLHHQNVTVLGSMHPYDILSELTTCRFALCTRMHSVIFCLVAGVPFAALAYLPKVQSMLEWLELTDWSIPYESFVSGDRREAHSRVLELLSVAEASEERVIAAREKARARSWQNAYVTAAIVREAKDVGT